MKDLHRLVPPLEATISLTVLRLMKPLTKLISAALNALKRNIVPK
jgi:hypothetical protein